MLQKSCASKCDASHGIEHTYAEQKRYNSGAEGAVANRQRDGNDDVGGVVVQRDCATMART
jgi:hypothetical protein